MQQKTAAAIKLDGDAYKHYSLENVPEIITFICQGSAIRYAAYILN